MPEPTDDERRVCPGRGCDSTLRRDEHLCRRCVVKAERAVADLPALAAELERAIARQGSAPTGGHGSSKPGGKIPLNLNALEKRNHEQLVTVAACELGYRPNPTNLVGTVYAILADVSLIQYRTDGPELARMIHRAVADWRAAIDHHEDRVFAGRCNECGQQMFARPNSKTFGCPTRGCEASYDTGDQLRYVLDQIRETLWPIDMIRQFAKNQLGVQVNTATVRSWRNRGQLVAHGLDHDGRETFRVGDYLDLAKALDARTKVERETA
jgi:hypothetical protein